MNETIRTRQLYSVTIISASPAAASVILLIAGTLGLDPQAMSERLGALPAVLVERVSAAEARRMCALLGAFGFRTRLEPVHTGFPSVPPLAQRRDLAIQSVSDGGQAAHLATLLGWDEHSVTGCLAGPEGLVLRGLDDTQINALRSALGKLPRLRLVSSDPLTATYDAFAIRRAVPKAELARLGLAASPISGAVATGMNHATARHLARRTGQGLVILNRAFLRFDLYLATAPGPAAKELVGFLESRSLPISAQRGPHRIDSDLPFDVACQFISDYTAIGLEVRARLRGKPALPPGGAGAQNP
jgi:hypothetical protein